MPLSSARAFYGLQGTFDLTSAATTGTASVGPAAVAINLPTTGQAWAVNIEVDGNGVAEINLEDGGPTITNDATAQVETATAAGTITLSGNATVTVTGDDITGSPLAISVAVLNGDTASDWATKVRTALNATAAITSLYTVGSATTAITLTRTVARTNDSTLNIALANGTCTGITAAPTSANTTAGVAPTIIQRLAGITYAADDAEGKALVTGGVHGFLVQVDPLYDPALLTTSDGTRVLMPGEIYASSCSTSALDLTTDWEFSAPSGYTKLSLVVINA